MTRLTGCRIPRTNLEISFEVDSDKYVGLGRIIVPDDEPELAKKVSELMNAKYQWSDGLIVELRPEPGVLQK